MTKNVDPETPRLPRVRRPRHTDPTAELDKDNDPFALSLTQFRWAHRPAMRRHYVKMTALVLSLAGAAWGSWKLAQWLMMVL